MRLTTPTRMIATALTIAVVVVPAAAAADIPAGEPAPGGDGRIASVDTNQHNIPEGFDFRVPSQASVPNWPAGQPAPGGNGLNIDGRSIFPEGQPALGGDGRVDTPVSYWPEGQPAPGGDGHVTTPNAPPIGFDFKAPADWVTATDSSPSPVSFPTPGGFDFTDAFVGAAFVIGTALLALGTALAFRRGRRLPQS